MSGIRDISTAGAGEVPTVLSHDELPEYLRRKRPRSVERAARQGRLGPIKPVKLGGMTYYLAADVAAYERAQIATRGSMESGQ